MEGQGGRVPLTAACAPHFGQLKLLLLDHHATTRPQTMIKKGIITFKHYSPWVFSRFFCEIAGNQLLHINVTQYSVVLTRLYRCFAEENVRLQNCYRCFVSGYDMKQT